MDSIMSLSSPLKQFTSCLSGTNPKGKRGNMRTVRRSSFSRRKSISRRRSLPCSSQKVPDSWLRIYQEDLKKERQRQQAVLAKKNAEKAVRKAHFRSHHCLPRSTPAKRPAQVKDESFFGAFQGLSLEGLSGSGHGSPAVAAPGAPGEQCKVM